jgi:hypothetical protein
MRCAGFHFNQRKWKLVAASIVDIRGILSAALTIR